MVLSQLLLCPGAGAVHNVLLSIFLAIKRVCVYVFIIRSFIMVSIMILISSTIMSALKKKIPLQFRLKSQQHK